MNLAVYLGQTLTLNLTLALDPNSNPNRKLMHNNKLYPNFNLNLTPVLALTHDGLALKPPFSDAACRRP